MKTLWWSQCRCGVRKEVFADSKLTREEISKLFIDKHKMALFPCRCENCRGDKEEENSN